MQDNNLKELRKKSDETQNEIARLIGLKTASAYNKKENGKVAISLEEATILTKYFNQSVDSFYS